MSDIDIRTDGAIGYVTLNRPTALNALTHQMLLELESAMHTWAQDDQISALLIDAAGDRAFCAGGDIVSLYQEGVLGKNDLAKKFWRDEYRINLAIANYPKPYIAIMDGIVMGGGVGVSSHGSHRIVTERTMFAMPECSIGLIPDVGGSYFLGQSPGFCGEYIGLTGTRLSGADCIYAGFADFFVPSEDLPKLKKAILKTGDVAVIADFAKTPDVSSLQRDREQIDQCFSSGSVSEIKDKLQDSDEEFALAALKGLDRGAPLGLMAALKAIRAGRADADLALALRNEYRFVTMPVSDGEFIEGVRAAVIEKDRTPNWKYPTLADVPKDVIGNLDKPAADGDFVAVSS